MNEGENREMKEGGREGRREEGDEGEGKGESGLWSSVSVPISCSSGPEPPLGSGDGKIAEWPQGCLGGSTLALGDTGTYSIL